jgi:hypothetical protein
VWDGCQRDQTLRDADALTLLAQRAKLPDD